MKILSWNVNGLRAVHKKGFLEWLKTAKPDILCVQETKAGIADLPPELTTIPGYHSYFSEADKKGYSGTALYTRKEPDKISSSFGAKKYDNEGRIIRADFNDTVLFNIYFPNGKASPERLAYKYGFYDAFLDALDKLKKHNKKVIITGDVNTAHKEIDLARPKENSKISGFLPEERAWIDKVVEHGFIDTFRMFQDGPGHYTWWDLMTGARERNVGWRIDYFFVSENLKASVKNAFILPDVMGSDHCPVGIDLQT
ncbi:MAG: exodeoxyribonuclease III [Candidatus Omnitrophica bacterium]|nr:exodeoxyribonuclease III [Candidatus Omnitrophota bacterium]